MLCQAPCAITNCEPAMVAVYRKTIAAALAKLERARPIALAELDAVKFDVGKLTPYGAPLTGDEAGHVKCADLVASLTELMERNENARASRYFAEAMTLCLLLTDARDAARIEALEDDLGASELALNDALGALALSSRDDVEAALAELEANKEALANLEALVESMKGEISSKGTTIDAMREHQLEIGRVTVERDRARRDAETLASKLAAATTLLNAKSAELERSEAFRHDAVAKLERDAKREKKEKTALGSLGFSFCGAASDPPPPNHHQPYDLSGTPFDGIETLHERAVFE